MKIKNKMVLKLLILLVCSIIFPFLYSFQASLFVKMLLLCVFLFTGINLIREMGNRKRSKEKDRSDNNDLSVYYSSEALDFKDKICHELKRLVSAIAEHDAKAAGKLATRAEVKAGLPDEKLILSEDMELAFKKAVKETTEDLFYCPCGEPHESLMLTLKKLIKKYENQTP